MKELPIETQFLIMDLLREGKSIRYIHKETGVAMSTIQDYKKNGPPFYRKNKKNQNVELYPPSVSEENIWLRKSFQELYLIAHDAVNNVKNRDKKIQELTQSNNQKIESLNKEIETIKQELNLKNQEINQIPINFINHITTYLQEEYKNFLLVPKDFVKDYYKISDELHTFKSREIQRDYDETKAKIIQQKSLRTSTQPQKNLPEDIDTARKDEFMGIPYISIMQGTAEFIKQLSKIYIGIPASNTVPYLNPNKQQNITQPMIQDTKPIIIKDPTRNVLNHTKTNKSG